MDISLITNERNGILRMWSLKNGKFECVHECDKDEHKTIISDMGEEHTPHDNDKIYMSTDGERIATVCNNILLIWSTIKGKLISSFKCPSNIQYVAMSDQYIAILYFEEEIEIYTFDYKLVYVFDKTCDYQFCLAFSPDGKYLFFANGQDVTMWDVIRKQTVTHFYLKHWVDDLAISSCSNFIVALTCDKGYMWNKTTGDIVSKFKGDENFHCLSYSSDGMYVAMGDHCGKVKIWSTTKLSAKWILKHTLKDGRDCPVKTISFSIDNKLLASSSENCKVCIWDVEDGTCRQTLFHSNYACCAFVPIDYQAMRKREDITLAISIIMDQRELPDDVFVPREVWYRFIKCTSWKDFI